MGNGNGHDGPVNSVAFFGTKYAITGSDDATIKIWNIETGKCIKTLTGGKFATSPVSAVAVLSEREGMIVCGHGQKGGYIKLWSIGTYLADRSFVSKTLTGVSKTLTGLNNMVRSRIQQNAPESVEQTFRHGVQLGSSSLKFRVNSLAIAPGDGWSIAQFISGWEDGRLRRIKLDSSGEESEFKIPSYHEEAVNSVAMNETYIVSGSTDKTIGIWYANNGKFVKKLEGHEGSVRSVIINGNRIVSGSGDKTIKIWDINTGKCIQTLTGHTGPVNSVAMNETYIVSGSVDTVIRVCDANTGKGVYNMTSHTGPVNSVAINGNCVISGSDDETIAVSYLPERGETKSEAKTNSIKLKL